VVLVFSRGVWSVVRRGPWQEEKPPARRPAGQLAALVLDVLRQVGCALTVTEVSRRLPGVKWCTVRQCIKRALARGLLASTGGTRPRFSLPLPAPRPRPPAGGFSLGCRLGRGRLR
jgi:hypothetical protein